MRLHHCRGDLRASPCGEAEIGLLATINGQTLKQKPSKTRASASSACIECHETLKASAVVLAMQWCSVRVSSPEINRSWKSRASSATKFFEKSKTRRCSISLVSSEWLRFLCLRDNAGLGRQEVGEHLTVDTALINRRPVLRGPNSSAASA